jgi:DNA-binding CsgD family transcriptional regulator
MRETRQEERISRLAAPREREKETPTRAAEGRTKRELGGALGFGEITARSHLGSILDKLGLTSRAQAAAYNPARYGIEDCL